MSAVEPSFPARRSPDPPRAKRVIAIPDFELGDRLTPEQVDYLPFMDGPIKRKHEGSSTPFYFHLKSLVGY